jgi:hypothetical protein
MSRLTRSIFACDKMPFPFLLEKRCAKVSPSILFALLSIQPKQSASSTASA